MAKSSLGKLVSRVGASGGGKTYQKTRPAAYYSVISLIVVIGLASVVYSRYERQHPIVISHTFPAKGTTGYVALSTEECGNVLAGVPAQVDGASAFTVLASNVVKVDVATAAEAGSNATIGAFMKLTPGLVLTTKEMTVPDKNGVASAATTFKAGEVCPTGTKYAGRKGYPILAYWSSISQSTPTLTNDPSAVQLTANMLFTFAFEPKGVTPKLPPNSTISALFTASSSTSTTTTSAPSGSTTTTTATGTTSSTSTTTTTVSSTTTTTKPTTTTTAKG